MVSVIVARIYLKEDTILDEQELKEKLKNLKYRFYTLVFFSLWGLFAFLQLAINSECF